MQASKTLLFFNPNEAMEEVQNMRQSQNDTFVICRALL
jgi:hypothetical protein